jgi:class 3 adenylate cyclase
MSQEQQQLQSAIAALEAQRAVLGDVVVDSLLVPARAKLAALAAPASELDQTLRQVTILFLDVVGSTALSQHLDPEAIHAVMDDALVRCSKVVAVHLGKVLQYAGDNLLAAFGASEVREDDAERAVRCGLALLELGRVLSAEVRVAYGHTRFNVRVGIHTGGVLLGGGVDAEGTIRGIAVSVAARMEQAAPAGALRISHDTYRHVRGVFDVEPQPPMQVKGNDEPIVTYLVLRAKPRAFRVVTRGIEGVETRMVGRDAELDLLKDAFERLYQHPRLAAASVVAEAGIGKSRLLYEFQNWAEARAVRFYLFQARAQPQTRGQAYGLLRDLLAWRLQIADNDSMAAARQKFEQGSAPLFERDDGPATAQAHAHVLGQLIGLDFGDSPHVKGIRDDGRQIRDRGFHAAALLFRSLSARHGLPIVLLMDDLHWADDGSLDFLSHLADVNRDLPMLLLGLTRPELFERRATWSGLADATRIDLLPLDAGASATLADELLKKLPVIPAALRELITGVAEGNPYHMEELVKMLADEGAIDTRQAQWSVVADKLQSTHVPQTLTGVLQARLDGLQPAERLALQQAAVIGLVFWDQALAAIDARAVQALPSLVRRDLLVLQLDADFEGVRAYAFKHHLLHQVTYDTLLKRKRRDCHAKVAAWLAGLSGARANDFLGATAEHFEKAGDMAQALEYLARAAELAAANFAHESAMGHVVRAMALLSEGAGPDELLLRWRLLAVRERILDLRGRRAEQHADIEALQRLADALDGDARRADVAWRRGDIALRTADYRAMEHAARETMALAESAADPALALRAQSRLAIALGMLGDAAAGRALALDGLAAARAQGLRIVEAGFLNALSLIVSSLQDDLVLGLEVARQSVLIERELANPRNQAKMLCNLGSSLRCCGERVEARQCLEQGLQLLRAAGDRAGESFALSELAMLALWQDDAAQSLEHAQSALEIAIAVQNREIECYVLLTLGDAERALEHHAAAQAAFERSHAVALAIDHLYKYDAAAGLARAALARGDAAGALQRLQALLAHLAVGGSLVGTASSALILLTCYQVLARAGDPRAAELLANAHAELQARTGTITDATLRHSFLNHIPEHREIVAEWDAHQVAFAGRQ